MNQPIRAAVLLGGGTHRFGLMAEQNFQEASCIADRGYIIVHGEIAFEGRNLAELRESELVKSYYLGT